MIIKAMLTGSKPDENAYAAEVDIEETSYAGGRGNQLHLDIEGCDSEVIVSIDDDTGTIKLAYTGLHGKRVRVAIGTV